MLPLPFVITASRYTRDSLRKCLPKNAMSLEIELAAPTIVLRFDLDIRIDGTLRRIIQDMVALSSRGKDLKYKASIQSKGWIVKLIALYSRRGKMDQVQSETLRNRYKASSMLMAPCTCPSIS